MYNNNWHPEPCKDCLAGIPEHRVLYGDLGFEPNICNVCHAHIRGGICLNACHLSEATKNRFYASMKSLASREQTEKP